MSLHILVSRTNDAPPCSWCFALHTIYIYQGIRTYIKPAIRGISIRGISVQVQEAIFFFRVRNLEFYVGVKPLYNFFFFPIPIRIEPTCLTWYLNIGWNRPNTTTAGINRILKISTINFRIRMCVGNCLYPRRDGIQSMESRRRWRKMGWSKNCGAKGGREGLNGC